MDKEKIKPEDAVTSPGNRDKTNKSINCITSNVNSLTENFSSNNEIKIVSISPIENRGALKAFVHIQVGPFSITDCRIVQDNGAKPWVSMPALSYKDPQGTIHYKTLIKIEDKKLKNEISQAVLQAWENNGGEINESTKDS